MPTPLDAFFAAINQIQIAGFPKPQRPILNFLSGVTAVDNPGNNSTDLTLSGGSSGGSGGTSVTPLLVTALATTVAGATHQTLFTDGYSVAGDGGGGSFIWNSTDTRAADGGTIIAVTGVPTGRWNRVFQGTTLDARWFGGKPDGVTDNTAVMLKVTQAANAMLTRLFGVLPPTAYPGWSPINIYLASGGWVVSGTAGQAGIELPPMVGLIGDGFGSMIIPSTATVHCVRIANLLNSFRGINFIGGKCAIVTCGPTRYPLIWTAWAGSLGTLVYEGVNYATDCSFQGQSGPSNYTDTTIENRDAASSFVITRADVITSCFTWVDQDDFNILDSYIQIDQSGSSWPPQATDDNGNIMPAFLSMNQLKLERCEIVPVAHSGLAGLTSCMLAGYAQFKCIQTRFGGESTFVIARTTTSKYKFNGVNIGSLYNPQGQQPTLDFDACAMASADVINWLEVYDTFPLWINVRNFSPSTNGPGVPPLPRVNLMQSLGVWIDSATCPTSSYLKQSREAILINIDPFTSGPDFRFRTSTNPALQLGAAGVTDVTQELRRYLVGNAARSPFGGGIPTLGVGPNLWPTGILQLSQASTTTAPGLTAGTTDTETGYTIQGYHFSGASATGTFGFNNAFTPSAGSGEYTISLGLKAGFSSQLQIQLTDAVGGTNAIPLDTLDFSAGDWQRLETTFYWDGTTYAGSGSAGVTFSFGGAPSGLDFFLAFFAIQQGRGSRPWNYPGNSNPTNYIPDVYYGTTTPVAGTYKLGDTYWNTNTIVGQPVGWKCIRGGTYGGALGTAPLWSSFGTLNFDPSQIASYNFDYDAATVAPTSGAAAITSWPSKYGGSDTAAHYGLTGTATAHASGGTGPNGAPYVSANGTTNVMTEANQSSQTVAKELYIVAKFDTTGGASGTLWDGGITNTGRVFRPSANHVELLLSGALGPAVCNDTEIWSIWHVIADGTNGELDINGNTILPNQAYATTFLNGVAMFAAPSSGGADFAQASIARAIGFTATLSAAQRTSMANYLLTLYGVH